MQYGLPKYNKYPIDTIDNIKKCVQYFDKCPEQFKEELATNIYKASLREGYEIDGNESLFRYVNFNESYSGKKIYHLSESNLDGKILTPRIPENYMTKNGYEENKTPRISFSTSIDGCLIGISANLKNKEFYIHEPENYSDITVKNITNSQVPDASLTKEVWVTTRVKLKVIGKIKVIDALDPPLTYKYGKNTAETYRWKWKNINLNEEFDFDKLLGRNTELEILTEAPKTGKRKEIETLIYNFFNIIDITGKNTDKYKKMFSKMTDEQFNKYMKKFLYDDNLNFYLEVLPNKNEPNLKLIKQCADMLKVPLDEYVYYRHDGDKDNPLRTAYRVPTGYLILKRMQQTLSKKNTYSLSISSRNMKTGTVTGHDKIARLSDIESYSLAAIGADNALKEFLGSRADNMESKTELYKQIGMYGYAYLKDLPENIEKSQAINTVAVYLMGAGLDNDLLNKEEIIAK